MQVDFRGLQIGGHGGRGDQHEDLSRNAPDGGRHGVDVQPPIPEARKGSLIAEDEHETHDDGEGGDLGIVVSTWFGEVGGKGERYDAAREGKVCADMLICKHHEGGNDSVEEDREGDGWNW